MDVAPESNVYLLPDEVPNEAGAILDVYACAVHTIHRVPALPMHNVVVVGAGPIGLSILEAYKAIGVRSVIVVAKHKTPQAKAVEMGADHVVDPVKGDAVQAVMDLTDGEGADVVIEAVGGRADTFGDSIHMLARNGSLGIIGMYVAPQTLDTGEAMNKQIQMIWINSYAAWEGVPEFQITIDMIVSGLFNPVRMVTHRFPLDDIADGFAAVANKKESGVIKALVIP
jgi:threonine dehydrogenase-like Zn-dependent dehydrogenase